MNIRGFAAAQDRYDSMLPPEPVIFTCKFSNESCEDCAGPECEGFNEGDNESETCLDCGMTETNHHDECEPEERDDW